MSNSLRPHGLYSSWNPPGQNTGVPSLSLCQGKFPTQGLNPGLQHCRWILYQLSHQGSPRILQWVAFPSPGDPPSPGIEPVSLALAGRFSTTGLQGKSQKQLFYFPLFCLSCFLLGCSGSFTRVPSKLTLLGYLPVFLIASTSHLTNTCLS